MTPQNLESAVRARLGNAKDQIQHTLDCVDAGNPLASEWEASRLKRRLQAKGLFTPEEAETMTRGIFAQAAAAPVGEVRKEAGPEKIWGNTLDFVGVAFLERGLKAARTVARVAYRDGQALGTGFLISNRLFITNQHVIVTAEEARHLALDFDYELDLNGRPTSCTRFVLDPDAFYLNDDRDDLDYAIVAVGKRIEGSRKLADYSYSPLSDASDKHALGEVANIVQHPDGRMKEVVLRENRLVARLETVLHYVADTEPGSSGSPVFNNEWQVIALHHWGGPWRQQADGQGRPVSREVNEGVRISAIVRELRGRLGELSAPARSLLEEALQLAERRPASSADHAEEQTPDPSPGQISARIRPDGQVTWSIPLEVSVRIPALAREPAAVAPTEVGPPLAEPPQVERALRPSKDYRDRSGYKPKFIKGFTVPLPTLSSKQEKLAARNRRAEPGDDPFELKYHHFSLVLHARRKLAFFTACNIDGTHAKKVNRKTGEVSDLDVSSAFSEALGGREDSEAREEWASDDRLLLSEQTNQALYDSQQVPGFPGGSSAGRLARMFQRGHLVRRMDPAWGTNDQARLADADTFHFTNCAPQLGFFNMGSAAKLKLDGSGGGKLWRALENHVLGNAVAEGLRVCSLTGPVFGADDIPWRGILVPLKFWKVVVWAEDGALRSLAMLADQLPVIQAVGKLPESLSDAEAFDELDEVEDFLSTVATIERLTGLDLGDQVREADIRADEPESRVEAFEEIALAASPRARKTKKPVRKPRRK